MANPLNNLSSLSPKTLGVIAVGGVGAGLLWRKYKGKSTPTTADTAATSDTVDTSQLALSGSSTGNLSSGGAGDSTAGRDTGGTIQLPIVSWVVTIDGKQYITDGNTLTPVNPEPSAKPPVNTLPVRPRPNRYQVKPGDSLVALVQTKYAVAGKELTSKVQEVMNLNGIKREANGKLTPWHAGMWIVL